MAADPANGVTWYLSLPAGSLEWLGGVRHWPGLRMALEEDLVWLEGLSETSVRAVELRALPGVLFYRQVGGQLFPPDSELPARAVPAVLWTPLLRALPVTLPPFNHNYFGLPTGLAIEMARSGREEAPAALRTHRTLLCSFLDTAPEVRLQGLRYALLSEEEVLILGSPLLPLDGQVYWQRGMHLLPAGFDFRWTILGPELARRWGKGADHLIWSEKGGFFPVRADQFSSLTRASVRITLNATS